MITFSFQRFFAYFRKEVKQIIRDPSTLIMAFGLPLLMIFIFGYGMSLDADKIRIGIVLEDTATEARSLVNSFIGTHYFNPKVGYNRKLFQEKLTRGDIRGIITIPENFSRNLIQGKITPFQLIVDGSEPNTARFIINYVTTVVNTWVSQKFPAVYSKAISGTPVFVGASNSSAFTMDPNQSLFTSISQVSASSTTSPAIQRKVAFFPINPESRVWFNPDLESRNVILPGSIAIIMSFIGTLLTALVVAREWERGTMEAIMATPLRMNEILLAKLFPYFFLGLMSMTLCVVTSILLFFIPFRGSVFILLLSTSIFLIASIGQGLLISSATRNQFVSGQIAIMLGFVPAFSLSGFVFEIESMPKIVQALTYLFPPRYFVTLLQSIFLSGTAWPLALFNLGMMGCIALFFFCVTLRKTAKRLD